MQVRRSFNVRNGLITNQLVECMLCVFMLCCFCCCGRFCYVCRLSLRSCRLFVFVLKIIFELDSAEKVPTCKISAPHTDQMGQKRKNETANQQATKIDQTHWNTERLNDTIPRPKNVSAICFVAWFCYRWISCRFASFFRLLSTILTAIVYEHFFSSYLCACCCHSHARHTLTTVYNKTKHFFSLLQRKKLKRLDANNALTQEQAEVLSCIYVFLTHCIQY